MYCLLQKAPTFTHAQALSFVSRSFVTKVLIICLCRLSVFAGLLEAHKDVKGGIKERKGKLRRSRTMTGSLGSRPWTASLPFSGSLCPKKTSFCILVLGPLSVRQNAFFIAAFLAFLSLYLLSTAGEEKRVRPRFFRPRFFRPKLLQAEASSGPTERKQENTRTKHYVEETEKVRRKGTGLTRRGRE